MGGDRVPVPEESWPALEGYRIESELLWVLRAPWVQNPLSHFLPSQGEAGVSGLPGGIGLRGPPVSDCQDSPKATVGGGFPSPFPAPFTSSLHPSSSSPLPWWASVAKVQGQSGSRDAEGGGGVSKWGAP